MSTDVCMPCPFCGFDHITTDAFTDKAHDYWIAECNECGATGPRCDNADEACEYWNTRTYAGPPLEET